jgi:hypothetical protein
MGSVSLSWQVEIAIGAVNRDRNTDTTCGTLSGNNESAQLTYTTGIFLDSSSILLQEYEVAVHAPTTV